jgi:hypothetical protein
MHGAAPSVSWNGKRGGRPVNPAKMRELFGNSEASNEGAMIGKPIPARIFVDLAALSPLGWPLKSHEF